MVDLKGYDETFNQMVRVRYSYKLSDVLEGHKFSKMYHTSPEGVIVLEIDNLNKTEPTA